MRGGKQRGREERGGDAHLPQAGAFAVERPAYPRRQGAAHGARSAVLVLLSGGGGRGRGRGAGEGEAPSAPSGKDGVGDTPRGTWGGAEYTPAALCSRFPSGPQPTRRGAFFSQGRVPGSREARPAPARAVCARLVTCSIGRSVTCSIGSMLDWQHAPAARRLEGREKETLQEGQAIRSFQAASFF